MNRIISLLVIVLLSISFVSAQEGHESPYALFGDNTFTLDIKHKENPTPWSIIVLLTDSTFAAITADGDSLRVKDMSGNTIASREVNPTVRAIFSGTDPKADEMAELSPYVYCFGNPIKFIDKNGERPSEYEAVLMAEAAYMEEKTYNKCIDALSAHNWKVSEFNTSIIMNHTEWYENGLQSILFERTVDDKTEYAYVFAGTNSFEDGLEDMAQVFGIAPQYYTAINNAKTLDNDLHGSELTFVGHSLGGGEAAAASMATGHAAITFNPAAVSPLTKLFNNLGSDSQITNYRIIPEGTGKIRIGGCWLNNLQDNLGMSAPGSTIYVPIKSNNPFTAHELSNFKSHFEQE